jgi:alkanesulfonate monooxygenase SsuD/methylene tetrahydromethanopterin reductase-like flavin-dependent oxidoreductase (luciferase family)
VITIPPRPVLPRAMQYPHPPLHIACTKSDTVKLAADLGVGALVLGFGGPEEIAELRAIYDKAIAERTGERFVSDHPNDYFAALCPTVVLDDGAEAFRIGARGQRFFAESIHHWYAGGDAPSLDTEDDDNVAALARNKELLVAKLHEANIPVRPSSTGVYNPHHAYGTAETAINYVQRLVDAGADEIMCFAQLGTVPHAVCMETLRQWGEYVIPHFR